MAAATMRQHQKPAPTAFTIAAAVAAIAAAGSDVATQGVFRQAAGDEWGDGDDWQHHIHRLHYRHL
jgi:hypothetical protein